VSSVPEPGNDAPHARNRVRDFWQLDVPLVVVLLLCIGITVIEARRAGDGVWRAWIYMFEWPLIAAFAVWIWHRFRTEGNPVKGTAQRWRDRVAEYEAEAAAEAEGHDGPVETEQDADPQIAAWQEYQRDLHRREPPGGPQ
jgi:hypothetical protein